MVNGSFLDTFDHSRLQVNGLYHNYLSCIINARNDQINVMDTEKYVILKASNQTQISIIKSLEGVDIQRIAMPISPVDFIKLLHFADSKVNPRKAKINPIVKAIEETLEYSPELYYFYSKGILLSTLYFDLLDRNRVRLSFSEDEIEGIMDGGHNAFALGSYEKSVIYWK